MSQMCSVYKEETLNTKTNKLVIKNEKIYTMQTLIKRILEEKKKKKEYWRDFPAGTVVKTLPSKAGCVGSVPGWEVKIPHALRSKDQNLRQKWYYNKFIKIWKRTLEWMY